MPRASDPAAARHAATTIVRRLRDAGHIAYFAGGCVRDSLLRLAPTDYDIATDAVPGAVRTLFRSTDQVGAAFGVVLVHERSGGRRATVEVATFRSDGPYSDARRPDTIRFSDAPSDAARRDFTVNALFLDPLAPDDSGAGGRVIDYVDGLADLRAGIIRAVGDPDARLAEDHLRALRAVRFAARLGFSIEPLTAGAIARHAAELRGVSQERIGDELRRILVHHSRALGLGLLQQLGLDAPVLGGSTRDGRLPTVEALAATSEPVSSMLGLAAWRLDRDDAAGPGMSEDAVGEAKRQARAALCLSNDEADELGATLAGHRRLIQDWPRAGVAQRKRWASSPWFANARRLLRSTHQEALAAIDLATNTLRTDGVGLAPRPLITGDDLAAAGMMPGPGFRTILDGVYDAQLENRVRSRGEAMELAARLNV